ncbi:MAG TPA: mechanosensitive ion channel domain-containing protein [Leptolyngbyaceae cyanobacterium]
MIRLLKQRLKPRRSSQNQAIKRTFWAIMLCSMLLVLMPLPLWGQSLNLTGLTQKSPPDAEATSTNRAIAVGQVRLDGRELFAIAAPALEQNSQLSQTTPIRERVHGIENILNRIANSDFDPQSLEVTAEIDSTSNLPVISINDQYLMTVTTLDAQLQVQEPARWANQLTRIIEQALVQAHQERQPDFLTQQSLVGSGIVIGMLLGSWAITYRQRYLKTRRQQLAAPIPSNSEILAEPMDEAATAIAVEQREQTRQRLHLNDLKSRLWLMMQVGVWASGLFLLLGLFPYTRWLQSLLFSAPLKLLGIALGIYILVRVSDLAIERFTGALAQGNLIDPEISQRLSLRVSTFSRVLKSVARVFWLVVGLLTALSVVGVNLVPLLAGAGIIGLAISFAAQSLIKDVINGILILFEDQYAVGDVILVGEVSGFVENMNLRITQLRDSEGQLITIPNGTISVVRNLSKDWSRVDLSIELAYGTNPDHALGVIRRLTQDLYHDPDWQAKMPDPPEVLGIEQVNHTGMLIRVWIKTLPLQQWVVAREFRRRLVPVLEQEGLAIGVPQQSLWFRSSLDLDLEHHNGEDNNQGKDDHKERSLIIQK